MILKRKEEVNTKEGRIGILLNILGVNDPKKKGRGKYKERKDWDTTQYLRCK